MKVSDISEHRLVMFFIEGLLEPLHGWVKYFNPETLQDVIVRKGTWRAWSQK
jgi:hypothetical protein